MTAACDAELSGARAAATTRRRVSQPFGAGRAVLGAGLAIAAGVAAAGAARRVASCVRALRARASDLELGAEVADVSDRIRAERHRQLRHDAFNAIVAIEGAGTLLQRSDLPERDRTAVSGMLLFSLEQLRNLLVDEGSAPIPVDLAELARDVAADAEWAGRVRVEVEPGLSVGVCAAEAREVLRLVVRHLSDTLSDVPIHVRGFGKATEAGQRAATVELFVGQPGQEHQRLPRRNPRIPRRLHPPPAPSSRVEVAARLLRQHGGDVQLESADDGSELVTVSLPAAPGE